MNDTLQTQPPLREKGSQERSILASLKSREGLYALYIRYKVPILAVLVAFFALFALGAAAHYSLPGEPLYVIKTNVMEETVEKLHATSQSKASYQIRRMEERLREAEALSKKESVDPKAISDITAQATKHANRFEEIITKSIDSAFPKIEVMSALNRFASVSGAIETVSEGDPKLSGFGNTMEDIRAEAVNTYKKRVQSFVQTETPQTVLAYIQKDLGNVKDALNDSSIPDRTLRDAENYLDRVTAALQAQDLTKAIVSIGESYRIIAMQKYTGIIPPEPKSKTASSTIKAGTGSSTASSTKKILQ